MAIRTIRHCSISDDIKFLSLVEASTLPVTSVRGMVLVKPTSIAYSGTSASIGTNGQVTFSAVTSLSLNGVFLATYDNYVISMRLVASAVDNSLFRLRAAGTDATTNYTRQLLVVSSTSVTAARASDSVIGELSDGQRSGETILVYGPNIAQATAIRNISAGGRSSAMIYEAGMTHSTASAYDGFTFKGNGTTTITGAVQVYGVNG